MILELALGLAIFIALGLGWRYWRLRQGVYTLQSAIQRGGMLPSMTGELSDLAWAIHQLRSSYQEQLATLHIERARLAAILDQLTDAVIIADAEGRVRFANPAAEQLCGLPLPGRSVVEALRHHQLIEAWRRCRDSGQTQTESLEIPSTRQFLQVVIVPDRDTPGGTLLVLHDLTRIRRLETVRRDFISNLSHELRTPIASLKALAETLQDGALADPEVGPRFLARIQVEVDALAQMVQELLDLSRIESGQVELTFRRVEPQALLHSAAERMRVQAERAGVSLNVQEPASPLPEVRADPARLEQVLVNLIHNAIKFTRRGGAVTLSAQVWGRTVVFAVRDTGIGIPADELPRIFERFYRVDKSRSGGGTGLGLSIARHLVEAHGGRIWAQSREGEGSVFYFSIPMV